MQGTIRVAFFVCGFVAATLALSASAATARSTKNLNSINPTTRGGKLTDSSLAPTLKKEIPSPGAQGSISFMWMDELSGTLAFNDNRTTTVIGLGTGDVLWSSNASDLQYAFSIAVLPAARMIAAAGNSGLRGRSVHDGKTHWEIPVSGMLMNPCVSAVPGSPDLVMTLNSTWDVSFINFALVNATDGSVVRRFGPEYAPWTKGNSGATVGCPTMLSADFMIVGAGEVNSDAGETYGIRLSSNSGSVSPVVAWKRPASGYGFVQAGDVLWIEGNDAKNVTGINASTGAVVGVVTWDDLGQAYVQSMAGGPGTAVFTTYASGFTSSAYLNAFNAANGSATWMDSVNFRADGWQGSLSVDSTPELGVAWWQTSYGTSNYVYYACAQTFEWATGAAVLNWCASHASGVGDHIASGRTVAMLKVLQNGNSDTPWQLLVWRVPPPATQGGSSQP